MTLIIVLWRNINHFRCFYSLNIVLIHIMTFMSYLI